MDLHQEIYKLLQEIGPGRMMPTAYDTAWVARLAELGEPIGKQALTWIREHQLDDGSWGTPQPYYHHDRAVSTLAAVTALAKRRAPQDRHRLERARGGLETALSGLDTDPAGETIGFEMIVPTLLNEAQALGAIDHQATGVIEHLAPKRSAKLAALPDSTINRSVTLGFSAEMAGADGMHLLDTKNLQESDGSVSFSPSATAYYALHVRRGDPRALDYLQSISPNGSVPNVAPFNVFEPSWTLWNLTLGTLAPDLEALCQRHLGFLADAWQTGKGAAWTADYAAKDADVTSVTYEVLDQSGIEVDLDAVLGYETPYYFRCYALESTPSVSTNIHVLGALRQAGLEPADPTVHKVLYFLSKVRADRPYWLDKWHASPYYPTSHAIITCAEYADDIADQAVDWLLSTQEESGAWGFYEAPTAEETAYCLQALAVWRRRHGGIPLDVLARGSDWLEKHAGAPYPPLWIGKCLYSPVLVVRSAVLSALMLVKEEQAL